MLSLIPIFILLLALAALAGASRLQPGFRSHWMVAMGGAILAALSLVIIFFRLPLSATLSAWAISDQIHFPITIGVSTFSWAIGLAILVMLVLGLVDQMRQPVTLDWRTWIPGLLLAGVGLLAAFSADLLALAVSFFLLDSLTFAFHIRASADAQVRNSSLQRYGVNLFGVVVVLAAWSLQEAWPWLSQDLVLPALILRMGLLTPRLFQFPSLPRRELDLMLRFTGPISAISLLLLWDLFASLPSIAGWLFLFLLGLLIFALYAPVELLPRFILRLRVPARPRSLRIFPGIRSGLRWALDLLAKTLEGEAGILWAVLFVALFLSLAAQLSR